MEGHKRPALLFLVLLVSLCLTPTAADFSCLEYYKPFGRLLGEVTFPEKLISGDLARQCNAHCAAEPDCTAAWSVAGVTTHGQACHLLSHTQEDVAAALEPANGRSYPSVQPSFVAVNGSEEKSLSWLCLKTQQDWDAFGAITSRIIRPNATEPSWCAYATDSAGNNIGDWQQNSNSLATCGDRCDGNKQCSFWVGRPGHCWLKFSPLVGADGWTAAYRNAWLDQTVQPNAAATCFKRLQDWRELGQQLSPEVMSTLYDGTWYTLFPERVNFTEASAACAKLPDGRLAELSTQKLVFAVGNALLPTLPMQYTLQLAWVGAQGILDSNTAALISGDAPLQPLEAIGVKPTSNAAALARAAGGARPTWQATSQPVNTSLFTHPSEHYLQWRGSDKSFSHYVPSAGGPVCVAAIAVLPPAAGAIISAGGSQGDAMQDSPGLYLFTCRRPTPYICQSSSLPAALTNRTRVVPQAALPLLGLGINNAPNGLSGQQLALAIVLPVLAVLLLVSWLSCVCLRQLRSLLRALGTQRKRALGLPTKGRFTVVVTDIQGYTHLSETHPQAMGQAMLLHNKAIQKAAYANAGHVLAQEGDAFILGFSEPIDAAIFAIQVQHLLMSLEFPRELCYADDDHTVEAAAAANMHPAATAATAALKQAGSVQCPSCNGNGSSSTRQQQQHLQQLRSWSTPAMLPTQHSGRRSACPVFEGAAVIELPESNFDSQSLNQRSLSPLSTGMNGSMSPSSDACNGTCNSSSSGKHGEGKLMAWLRALLHGGAHTPAARSNGSTGACAPAIESPPLSAAGLNSTFSVSTPNAVLNGSSGRRPSSSFSIGRLSGSAGGFFKALMAQRGKPAQQGLFKGLRVRVGLSTGHIKRGQAVEATSAYSMARVISECAAGGQVLMDAPTFLAIRAELQLLGAVGPTGLDFGRLEAGKRAAAAALCLQPCMSQQDSHNKGGARPAIVLDMGLYETPLSMLPSTASCVPSTQGAATTQASLQLSHSIHSCGSNALAAQASTQAPRRPSSEWRLQQQPQQQPQKQQQQQQRHPLVSWRVASLSRRLSSSSSSARTHSSIVATHSHHSGVHPSLYEEEEGSASRKTTAAVCCGQLRLYQLVAPDLAGRAVVFGTQLALCDTWRCLEPPFFAAPGLSECEEQQPSKQQPPGSPAGCLTTVPSNKARQDARGTRSPIPEGASSPLPHLDTMHSHGSQPLAARSSSIALVRALSVHANLSPRFSQTGATEASVHGGAAGKGSAPSFPNVAVVFVVAEGAEELLQQQRHPGVRQLHAMLHALMRDACAALRGYLVKSHESELKFMATFSTAAAAVEWCVLVQEAALHLPYSDELLRQRCCRPVCGAAGQLLFRGPRLKMGVAEGQPACIMPDHLGRADYFGAVVNQAARVCDAAAHGGQVAVEQGLAQQVLQCWHTQQRQRQQQVAQQSDDAAAGPAMPQSHTLVGAAAMPRAAGTAASPTTTATDLDLSTGFAQQHSTPAAAGAFAAAGAVAAEVVAQQLGSFLFKGCAKSLSMVSFSLAKHVGRKYPAEPPKGKGVRLSHSSEVLAVVEVLLPSLSLNSL